MDGFVCSFDTAGVKNKKTCPTGQVLHGAADEARTRYLHLGKVALYQMSYSRIWDGVMNGDTIFQTARCGAT